MVSIRELVDRSTLGLEAVVADGLDREIRWTHPTELPDPGPYLGTGELVLTNGLWCHDAYDAEPFVRRMVDAGAVGLVFGLRAEAPRVPDSLVTACERHGVPLLALPVEVPFTTVTRAVAEMRTRARRRELLTALRAGGAPKPGETPEAEIEELLAALTREVESRFAGELIDMVLSGPGRADELRERLRSFGIDGDGPVVVLAIGVPEASSLPRTPVSALATDFCGAEGLPAVVPVGSRDAIVFAGAPERADRTERWSTELAHRLARALGEGLSGRRVAVGVGCVAEGRGELRRGLLEAREALRTAEERGGAVTVATFADVGSHRLLLAALDDDTRREFAESVLGPARAHDRRHRAELEHTLATFLDHGRGWRRTAEVLHVHVNTLRNRLAKVERLTGRSLDRTADVVDLYLALTVAETPTRSSDVAQRR